MKSFTMELELTADTCAADAWDMAQSRLADIARIIKVVDVESGEFVKPLRPTPRITIRAARTR